MSVHRNRDRDLTCAAGELQHRAGLLPGQAGIEGQMRADRQERVVQIRVIVEVGTQNGLRKEAV